MDNLSTPGGMLDQFGIGVQLINSMFVFMMNQKHAEAGDLLPLIIYGIINSKPRRMIFNINFIKYFMSENQLLGNIYLHHDDPLQMKYIIGLRMEVIFYKLLHHQQRKYLLLHFLKNQ